MWGKQIIFLRKTHSSQAVQKHNGLIVLLLQSVPSPAAPELWAGSWKAEPVRGNADDNSPQRVHGYQPIFISGMP